MSKFSFIFIILSLKELKILVLMEDVLLLVIVARLLLLSMDEKINFPDKLIYK